VTWDKEYNGNDISSSNLEQMVHVTSDNWSVKLYILKNEKVYTSPLSKETGSITNTDCITIRYISSVPPLQYTYRLLAKNNSSLRCFWNYTMYIEIEVGKRRDCRWWKAGTESSPFFLGDFFTIKLIFTERLPSKEITME